MSRSILPKLAKLDWNEMHLEHNDWFFNVISDVLLGTSFGELLVPVGITSPVAGNSVIALKYGYH